MQTFFRDIHHSEGKGSKIETIQVLSEFCGRSATVREVAELGVETLSTLNFAPEDIHRNAGRFFGRVHASRLCAIHQVLGLPHVKPKIC